jgi:hypothetical protein
MCTCTAMHGKAPSNSPQAAQLRHPIRFRNQPCGVPGMPDVPGACVPGVRGVCQRCYPHPTRPEHRGVCGVILPHSHRRGWRCSPSIRAGRTRCCRCPRCRRKPHWEALARILCRMYRSWSGWSTGWSGRVDGQASGQVRLRSTSYRHRHASRQVLLVLPSSHAMLDAYASSVLCVQRARDDEAWHT